MLRTVTRRLSKHHSAAFWTAHLITGPRYRRTSSNTGTHHCISSTFIATLRRENSGSTRTKQRPHPMSQISLKDFPKSTERPNPGQEPRASCEAKWGPAAEPAWPWVTSLSTQNTCGHRGTGVFARPSYLSNSTIMASSSAQPSPASASSSTLIATPSASADKLVVVSSMPARPLSALPVPTSKTPTPSSPPQPHSKSQQQPTGLVGLGILNAPTVTPARSISTTTPARRALSVNAGASATKLSERGFVEPHHSNVPRRAGTQVRRKRTEPLALSPPPTPSLPSRPSFSGPPPPPELEPELELEQPTTPRDTPNPNASRMPTHLLSLRLPPSPTLPLLPAYPSYHSLSAALSSSNVLPTSTALPSAALPPNTSAPAPKSAAGSTQLPRRKPRLTRRESAAPAPSKPDEPTGVDVFGPFEQPVPALSSCPPPATAVAQPQPTASIDHAQSTPQPTTREERRAQKHALLELKKEERRKRNETMCLQRVGATSGIEVGFLERGLLEFLKEEKN
ncbi:hypothetical protein BDN70DRAFT_130330 [Pholiota conissans]|uniref:Uncharacterized protein n=1 Tax=Pholiota conissans TaxID=109636 RepID=A0A9P5Z0B0_9AGAR|nr:hypothetical protein BDN70DRAFT_130330 [Pholiota conissans]